MNRIAGKGHSAKAPASNGSSCACTCVGSVQGWLLTSEASICILAMLWTNRSLHPPGSDRNVGEYLQYERYLLVDSLGNRVRELQEEMDKLTSIHEHEVFILMHKEISSIMEKGQSETALEDTKDRLPGRWKSVACQLWQYIAHLSDPVTVQLEHRYEAISSD